VAAIEVSGLTRTYVTEGGRRVVHALHDVSLTQPESQFLAIMGPSGCGKSTLLNIIAGFEAADSGRCLVQGRPVGGTGPDRGVVFQEYALFPWMTVERNLSFAMRAAGKWTRDAPGRIGAILHRMGLDGFRNAYPKTLSGGMRQRVAIARLLAIDSPIMLMDEPFGALDALTRSTLQAELVALWADTRKTILFITHSVDEAVFLAQRVVVMTPRPGRIVLDMSIDLPHPRDVTDPRFNDLKREILSMIHPGQSATSLMAGAT
jgi:NitT/TauT family transport system ATP-binding protein